MKRFIPLILIALLALLPSLAGAGSSEAAKPVFAQSEIAAFSNRVQKQLAAQGANVAIVARTGRDPSTLPSGILYTHVAYWVYSRLTAADGTISNGYRVHNLYQLEGAPTRSRLVQDSPADFFAGAYKLDAGIIVPDARLQQKLLNVISSPTYAALHNPDYAVLANPHSSIFQNCTEHTLDVMMAALYATGNTQQIKANSAAHFVPQPIGVNAFKRAMAPLASEALRTHDHGDQVNTATFGSIARFMRTNDLEDHVYRITPYGMYHM